MGGFRGLTGGRRAAALTVMFAGLLALGGCGSVQDDMQGANGPSARPAPAASGTPSDLHAVSFSELPGWSRDDQGAALKAFRRSCERIVKLGSSAPLDEKTGSGGLYGDAGDWQPACHAALQTGSGSARAFFERWFVPVRFPSETRAEALFTGYYEPIMHGSLTRHGVYQTPILAPPAGFAEARRSGVIFPARADIEAGGYDAGQPIVWLENPVDAFFLHVQGSGRVTLEDGRTVRLAFAGKNGRPYTSIGKVLIDRGAIPREKVSMQTIRAWLEAHPDQAKSVMDRNESYIFFRRLDGVSPALGPVGAGRVHLTPGRSIAVDRSYHPLGALFYLSTSYPTPGGNRPLDHLMVAQDTGSAILGLQRADVFIGSGDKAAWIAGHMKSTGELYALVPKDLAP